MALAIRSSAQQNLDEKEPVNGNRGRTKGSRLEGGRIASGDVTRW